MSWTPQPPPVPASPFATSRGPGTVGYWIGGLLILAALVGGTIMVIVGFTSLLDTPVPVGVEGSLTVDAEAGEGFVIYLVPSAGGFGSVDCRVIDPSGGDLDVEPLSGSLTLTINGVEYLGDQRFQAGEAGEYLVNCNSNGVAVGQDVPIIAGIGLGLGGIFLGVLGVLAGIGLIVITATRRGRHQRVTAVPGAAYPQYPQYPGQP